jgi:HlyD family secretion protein
LKVPQHETGSPRRGAGRWPIALGIVLFLGAGSFSANRWGWFAARNESPLEGATVKRGPLKLSLTARGNLKAADSVSLKSEVEGRTTILFLVPEGTHVNVGDLVCELDATALVDKRFQQTLAVSNAEASFVKAKQNFEIQESQNGSDIARAVQKLEFSEEDLKKYLEGERASEFEKAKESIELAKEEAARAEDKLIWSEKLAQKGFLTNSELEADKLARNRVAVALTQATRELDLLERFQLPRKESELRAALEEAHREKLRVELQAKAHIVDFEADVRTSEARFQLEQEKLKRIEAQIEKARIKSPRAGLVVYAQRDNDEPPIQEGTEIRERQEIVTIPNAAGMIVQSKLHESVLKQVKIGQSCNIKVDALPGQVFEGRVSFVALLPDQNSWWSNPNTRLYRTDIEITSKSEEMRPGMSCAVEILVEEVPDTIYVPLQAVFRRKQDNVGFVSKHGSIESRIVTVGRQNEQWVQILTGLEVGETVLLSAPIGLAGEPATPPKSDTGSRGTQ